MTAVAITGAGVLSAAGRAPAELAAALSGTATPECDPGEPGLGVPGFDTRAELGRKGTSFFDRRTALAVVACRAALEDAGIDLATADRKRVGIVLGTSAGSVKSSVEYAVETFTQDRPHMVNPGLFPTTVMNCAAGQAAIWFGLRGVNATLAGGPLALVSVLRYGANLLSTGQADVLLAGVVDELTPHAAWLARTTGLPASTQPGEGGAVFTLSAARREAAPDAEILGVALGFAPEFGDRPAALGRCVRRALASAATVGADRAGDVTTVSMRSTADERQDRAMWRAVCRAAEEAGARKPESLTTRRHAGDCGAATAALDLAALIGRHRASGDLDGRLTVLAAHSPEGAVGAAVVRGWSRGPDQG
ncbi:beta-ketoacyl synthase N-terminal-like domain-containing protein [Qaidamihabitans albus]|uniref:beta-ketoacyl synthase N-terminal-like domain-containing protein n=1 Tax=Qaidamihabitans albus TaxID=2795733 RepID=UPI0018F141F0|nr:beta-ketoacyl synthase N-terminal-like domain-containing protein [Qaidamihabitans albus]